MYYLLPLQDSVLSIKVPTFVPGKVSFIQNNISVLCSVLDANCERLLGDISFLILHCPSRHKESACCSGEGTAAVVSTLFRGIVPPVYIWG